MDRGEQRRPAVGGEGQRQPVQVVVHEVELGRARQGVGDVHRLPDPAVQASGPRRSPAGTPRRAPPSVWESRVANSVTSMPRATSPSASRLVTCSQGP